MYSIVKPLLFALPPERAHHFTLATLKALQKTKLLSLVKTPVINQPVECFGLRFENPIGLAAGLDNNGECIDAMGKMGFGFLELGGVTPVPQEGNIRPRLFRLPKNEALINRMGFRNKGVDYLIEKIKKRKFSGIVGVNIAKNRETPLNEAFADYMVCYEKVYPFADYVTVNVSSPNTTGLKSLQHGDLLKSIIVPLKEQQAKLSDRFSRKVPLVVKLSPDLETNEVLAIVDNLLHWQVEGVVATNSTTTRDLYVPEPHIKEEGGLSGNPLFKRSTEMVRLIYQHAGDQLPIIALGGIMSAKQAQEKFAAGAKLIQVFTGLIYRGPRLIREIGMALTTPY